MTTERVTEDNIFTFISVGNWILLAVLATAALVFFSPRAAAGVVVGGLLAIVNFYWLLSVLRRVLQMPVAKAKWFAQIRYVLRLAILAVILWALIIYVGIDIFGLLVGLSITVINIIALAVYKAAHKGG